MTTFLGEDIDFWIELKARADTLDVTNLLRENATMRAKLSFFESQLADATRFVGVVKDMK